MTDFDSAIQAFWTGRDLQAQKQIESGKVDAGTRGAVTGGGHLQPMQDAVAELFEDPDLGDELVIRQKGKITLPGYYRRSKDWDLVVQYKDALVAAIEFKSQVGPSFGNNFNNRTEESLGNAVDIWRATEEGLLGPVRPWLAFVMVIEHADKSSQPLTNPRLLYPADPIFTDTSYIDRYRIMLRRQVRERLYDAAAVVATEKGGGVHSDPEPELSLNNLAAAIAGRMAYIKALDL
ncbi:PaeR7I family type II restriction endonuclease [Gordonia sp. (in: high G+C Gram-positive bacteria)]|uniref:PaeR7I family type II restriction endonuclease n=1 Tax=Gordonia sp. (in: high G+C Gram-positive bacteria) TaxID=84139 RepID=UPI0039E30436